MSPQKREELRQQHEARIKTEQELAQRRLKRLQDSRMWERYHECMPPEIAQYWTEQGIPAEFQFFYKLGYVPEKQYKEDGDTYVSPALSIPFLLGQECYNLQYRLLKPILPDSKYRMSYGLPVVPFRTDPEHKPRGKVLLVEGAKKAIVCYIHLHDQFDYVIGSANKHVNDELVAELSDADQIFQALDPDAHVEDDQGKTEAWRMAVALGPERTRTVNLPVKPDDFFVDYEGTSQGFMRYVNMARPVVR